MSSLPIVVIGAGGHAAVIIELLNAEGRFTPMGVLDPSPAAAEVLGVPVLGGDDQLAALLALGVTAAVVALGANRLRQKIGERALALGFTLPSVVHPTALVSPSATLGQGVVIMARAMIGARASICDLAIVNTAAIVEHDNAIGAAAHVAPGTALGGNVTVGERALVGIGSAVRPGSQIGADAVVGAGSSVIADIAAGQIAGGVPARTLRGGESS